MAVEPELAPGEIHLWRISLSPEPAQVASRARLLSTDERERMARFRFDVHRERFALRRGAMRMILGRYLREAPEAIVFEYAARGKPGLREGRPSFNLSDSDDFAILGVTLEGAIGVDVERLRAIPDMDDLARRYFSVSERSGYAALAAEAKVAGFYNAWTRKEAWLKAKGEGLAVDLRSFDVTLAPGLPARLVATRDPSEDPARWTLHSFEPRPGFVAAAAAPARASRLVLLDF